jgi:hypothetical protein
MTAPLLGRDQSTSTATAGSAGAYEMSPRTRCPGAHLLGGHQYSDDRQPRCVWQWRVTDGVVDVLGDPLRDLDVLLNGAWRDTDRLGGGD